ncbi:MAG: hypothetical protein K6C35_10760 [Eubacterium sp.]|nr:hypothetical protein [Eubacterium sp.]SEF65824.1 Type II secretory pathway, pseudopilin PulG [Eubacterium ruminantium]
MSKMQMKKNKGFISVEAAFVSTIIMLMIVFSLYAIIYILNTAAMREYMYGTIYSLPLVEKDSYVKQASDKDALKGAIMWCDEYDMSGVLKNGVATMWGFFDMHGLTKVNCQTEYDVCTDRIRRWQFIDDISEKTIGE